MEVWKNLSRFPRYEVSDFGGLRRRNKSWPQDKRLKQHHYLKGSKNTDGYIQVDMTDVYGKRKYCRIHRLVMEAFVGPCPPGKECDHINRIRDDNKLTNIRYVTRKENANNKGKYIMTPARCVQLENARRELQKKYVMTPARIAACKNNLVKANAAKAVQKHLKCCVKAHVARKRFFSLSD